MHHFCKQNILREELPGIKNGNLKVAVFKISSLGLQVNSAPKDQRHDKQNQEYHEQDLCDPRRRPRNARKTQERRDQRNHEEDNRPT